VVKPRGQIPQDPESIPHLALSFGAALVHKWSKLVRNWSTIVCNWCEFIDYKTSMITDEDPLRGLFY